MNSRRNEAWQREQRSTIGSSLSAATFGAHEFVTQLGAYHVLTGGELPDISDKPDIIRGHLLEPIGALRFTEITGTELVHHPQDQFLYNKRYSYAHSLPDYHVVGKPRIIVEIKVPNPHRFLRLDAEVPVYWISQCFHHLAVAEAEAVILVALDPVSMDIWQTMYVQDDGLQVQIMDKEREFWERHVLPRIPPQPSSPGDFKLAWPTHVPGTSVIASDEIERTCGELVLARQEATAWSNRKEELTTIVKQFMADNECLLSDAGRVLATWRGQQSNVLDTKRLAEDLPDVVKEYRMLRKSRVFLVKDKILT